MAAIRLGYRTPQRLATEETVVVCGSAACRSSWIRCRRISRRYRVGGTPTVRANPFCRLRALTATARARPAVVHGCSGCVCSSSIARWIAGGAAGGGGGGGGAGVGGGGGPRRPAGP